MIVDPEVQAKLEEIESRTVPSADLPPEDSPIGIDEKDIARRSERSVKAAVAARIAGASYVEIAEMFDYKNPQTARHAVEAAMAGAYEDGDDIAALRGMTMARLETLLRSLGPKALSDKVVKTVKGEKVTEENVEHLAYARTYLSVVDRIAKLHGLDAPQVHRFETPDAARLNEVMAVLVQSRNALAAPEADIFGDEIVVEPEEES